MVEIEALVSETDWAVGAVGVVFVSLAVLEQGEDFLLLLVAVKKERELEELVLVSTVLNLDP